MTFQRLIATDAALWLAGIIACALTLAYTLWKHRKATVVR
jgi:cell division protein FtsL